MSELPLNFRPRFLRNDARLAEARKLTFTWMTAMTESIIDFADAEEDILNYRVADEMIEQRKRTFALVGCC
jgi:hypothetical protein